MATLSPHHPATRYHAAMPALRADAGLLPAFYDLLTESARAAVGRLAELAAAEGSPLYLVGGGVRDLLLARPAVDIDFVVTTDAPALARAFGRTESTRTVVHETFRTATVTTPDLHFDLVTARREHYPTPGALPVVTPAGLDGDLARRDFSINAVALTLSGPRTGHTVDPHGGRADLAAGILRVLHARSFADDATRIWRAARYVTRLNLEPDPATAAHLVRDNTYIATISPARIGHELTRVLHEAEPTRTLRLLDTWGTLRATLPGLAFGQAEAGAAAQMHQLVPDLDPELSLPALLVRGLDADGATAAVTSLALDRRTRRAVEAVPAVRGTLTQLAASQAPPSECTVALEAYPIEAVAVHAFTPDIQGSTLAREFLITWRTQRPLMTARDLQAAGIAPGPALGRLLRTLRAARLDGHVTTPADEQRLVATYRESSP